MILIEVPVYETEIQEKKKVRFMIIFHVYALDSKRQISCDTRYNVATFYYCMIRTAVRCSVCVTDKTWHHNAQYTRRIKPE